MDKRNCDVLIPLFFFQGRDVEAIIPLKFYLEKYFSYSVSICSVFDPYEIDRCRPKIVLMENTIGSHFHVKFAKYAYEKGYRVISLISEGLVIEAQQVEQGTWGHNKEKAIYFDKLLTWNKTQKQLIEKHYPQLKEKLEVTGAGGFDRYKVYSFTNKLSFLKKHSMAKYKTVVGYAGFVFSCYDKGSKAFIKAQDEKINDQFL
jgi:hypothetical protein